MTKFSISLITMILLNAVLVRSSLAGDTWLFTYPLDDVYTWSCDFTCHTEDGRPGGNDYSCPEGTAVLAAEDGLVIFAGWNDRGYGNLVQIQHGYGYVTYYAHNSQLLVSADQWVTQGSIIAESGHTGYVVGNPGDHLHFEVRQNGVPVDPYNASQWLWASAPPFDPPTLYSQLSYSGTYVGKSHSSTLVLAPESVVNCWIDFRCDPPFFWSSNTESSHHVALHSVASNWTDMENSPVIAGTGSLLDDDGSDADPNGVARFEFTITAPTDPGTYTLRTRVYHPHSGSFITATGSSVTFEVEVIDPDLSGEAFTAFCGYFNTDNKVDVGLWEHATGNVYIALRDPNSNRFIFDDEPWLEGFGDPDVDQLLVGDYSGDGYHDLCRYRASSGSWYVAYNQYGSTGGFVDDGCWLAGWASGGIGGSSDWIPLTADYSGDGYDDLCVFKPSLGRWVVAYNWDGYFSQATGIWLDDWGDGSYGTYWPFTGTVNYGAKQDVGCYHPGTGKWFVATSNSPTPSFTSQGEWLSGWASGSSTTWKHFIGKCTNDSYDDIIVYKPSEGKWCVAKNYQTYYAQLDGAEDDDSWLNPWAVEDGDEWQAMVGDVSGDGWTDLIVYSPVDGKWAVAYNNGGQSPPYFAQADGTDEGDSWLYGWGVETGTPKLATESVASLPQHSGLFQNYPNPFNPSTTISYSLPEAGQVTLSVYNVLGQKATTLVDEYQVAGDHTATWDCSPCPSGIYFYRLQTGGAVETKKMLLLK